jgi:hypothetical protein
MFCQTPLLVPCPPSFATFLFRTLWLIALENLQQTVAPLAANAKATAFTVSAFSFDQVTTAVFCD